MTFAASPARAGPGWQQNVMDTKGPIRAQGSPEGPKRSEGARPCALDAEHGSATRGRGDWRFQRFVRV
jgi:hypothetical protein